MRRPPRLPATSEAGVEAEVIRRKADIAGEESEAEESRGSEDRTPLLGGRSGNQISLLGKQIPCSPRSGIGPDQLVESTPLRRGRLKIRPDSRKFPVSSLLNRESQRLVRSGLPAPPDISFNALFLIENGLNSVSEPTNQSTTGAYVVPECRTSSPPRSAPSASRTENKATSRSVDNVGERRVHAKQQLTDAQIAPL